MNVSMPDTVEVDPADADAAEQAAQLASSGAAESDSSAVLGRALVVVVDDSVIHAAQPRADHGHIGTLVAELLSESGFHVDATVDVAADEVDIRNALNTAVIGGIDLVVSIGGVGVGGRDVTPEATAELLDQPLPGISEALRSSGLAAGATDAGLSRGLAGVSGQTLVVNLASSRAAVRDGMATLAPLATYIIREIGGV